MSKQEAIKIFDDIKVRTLWDNEQEKWYFSIVDIIKILTDSPNSRKYWSVLKTRLKKEGSELTTNCSQLKMPAADGKYYKTDVLAAPDLPILRNQDHQELIALSNDGKSSLRWISRSCATNFPLLKINRRNQTKNLGQNTFHFLVMTG